MVYNVPLHYNFVLARVHKRQVCAIPYPRVYNYTFLKWRSKTSHVGMVTTLIFLRNGWILLFWLVPLIHIRSLSVFARAVIVVNVALERYSFALQRWLECTHAATCPLYEGKSQDGKFRFGPVNCQRLYNSLLGVSPWLRNTYWVWFLQRRDQHH